MEPFDIVSTKSVKLVEKAQKNVPSRGGRIDSVLHACGEFVFGYRALLGVRELHSMRGSLDLCGVDRRQLKETLEGEGYGSKHWYAKLLAIHSDPTRSEYDELAESTASLAEVVWHRSAAAAARFREARMNTENEDTDMYYRIPRPTEDSVYCNVCHRPRVKSQAYLVFTDIARPKEVCQGPKEICAALVNITFRLPKEITNSPDDYELWSQLQPALVSYNASLTTGEIPSSMLDSFMHGKNVQHVVDLIQKILHLNVASSSQLVRISTNPARVVLRRFLAQLVLQKSTAPTNLLLSGITPSAQHALGEGSFGKVFKGAYENRVIAYKVFKTDRYLQNIDMNGPDIFSKVDMNHPWKMCLREMMMWWNIKHPNILGLLGIVTSPSDIASLDLPSTCANSMALILPYKRKLDVVEHMSHLEQEDLMVKVPRWMIQIAKALEYLHQEKIIHGDLRGKNVLVDDGDDDNVVLTDFGLSCFKDGMKGAMGTLCIGHNLYSAPEQLDPHSKNRRPTTATDVYSYARLCVELYTGAIPFNPVKDIFGEAHPSDAAVFHYLDNVCGAPPHPVFQYTGIHMDMKLWDVLTSCWIGEPILRPKASQLLRSMREALDLPNI